MFKVLILCLLSNVYRSSAGLSAVKNMSQALENANYMSNKSMVLNGIGMFVNSVLDSRNSSSTDLAQTDTKTGNNDTAKAVKDMTNSSLDYVIFPPRRELPLAMIIAGPVAAISILLFLCVTYYWHTVQLDKQAKRLSITLFVRPDNKENDGDARASTQKLVPIKSKHFRESDLNMHSQRRKSTLSVPTLVPPSAAMGKRGSSWSALADQEIINLSAPRRHSTFIL